MPPVIYGGGFSIRHAGKKDLTFMQKGAIILFRTKGAPNGILSRKICGRNDKKGCLQLENVKRSRNRIRLGSLDGRGLQVV